ncbi:hypothetical protein HWV62_10491 [Athelia sp. TMB]|nr:hypothetical protein HWV62_10491 [Athelia sp. TMB]
MYQNTSLPNVSTPPPGVPITNELDSVIASAVAAGAARSDITQTERHIYTPDGGMTVTCTQVTLTFFDPSASSPYRSLYGGSVEEVASSRSAQCWPQGGPAAPTGYPTISVTQSSNTPPPSPATAFSSFKSGDVSSLSMGAPPFIPHSSSSSPGAPLDLWADSTETYAQSARRARKIIRKQTPTAQRWYAVTRGSHVGVVQGLAHVRAYTDGVRKSLVLFYPNRELAEAAFINSLQAGLVKII